MKIVTLFFSILIMYVITRLSECANIRNKLRIGEGEPMQLNVTYYTPTRDLEEEKKYALEHVNYMKKVKRMEQKFQDDIELLKMVMNVQNIQISKLNEVVMVNDEIAKELLAELPADQ
jgi:hypothetical protein